MSENSKAWWRDPRFFIPSILVPVLALVIPMLLPDKKVTKRLSVVIEIEDPRRSNGFLGMEIENSFDLGKQSIKEIVTELSNRILERIESHTPVNPEDREQIGVVVNQEQDGSLFIERPGTQNIALHLTRFSQISTFRELFDDELPDMVAQMPLEVARLRPLNPRLDLEEEALPRRQDMRAGVFRVVLTAPGYRDAFKYISVDKNGEILGANEFGEIDKVEFPIFISLYPNFFRSGQLTIAIDPFLPCNKLGTHQPMVEDIGKSIQRSLEVKLRQEGFSTFVREPEMKLGFHPYRLKDMPPPPNHIFSDFLVKGSCLWMK